MNKTVKQKNVAVSVSWQLIERIFSAVIQFVLSVIIARLVLPEEYGIISVITVFITLADLLVNAGFGTALIQQKEITEEDVASVFTFSTVLSVILCGLLVVCAPFIAGFYKEPLIKPVLQIYSLGIWPFAVYGLLRSLLMKNLEFKKMCIVSVSALVTSGIAGVLIALAGGGVYALTFQSLINSVLGMCLLFLVTKWRPRLKINRVRTKKLWKYGWKLMISNLVDTAYKSIYTLCVPKFFGNRLSGYYNYGRQIPNVIVSTLNSTMVTVMFPFFAKEQSNLEDVKKSLRKTIRSYCFVSFPIMAGIMGTADLIIYILLGAKWMPAAKYLAFFCFIYGLQPVQNINFQAISARGQSGIYLKYELLKKGLGIGGLIISLPLGMDWLMWGQVAVILISMLLNVMPNKRWLNYTLREQIKDILPYVLTAGLMYAAVKAADTGMQGMNQYVRAASEVFLGIAVYVGVSFAIVREDVLSVWHIIRRNSVKSGEGGKS
ncbi:MAG: lipopolysaccharide biosynthesis protein [Butyrivibrio sp.]|nr:lipopolysaccharide biosynthesis protein [Ruminococcus flavefaciens]MCM1559167.1 lipopolysaccharide biosynthesis protein [Butyrivibrio sp.]